jgi:hypothetical protein
MSSDDDDANLYLVRIDPVPSLTEYRWLVNSGATSHMSRNPKLFIRIEPITTNRHMKTGKGRLRITSVGTVKMRDAQHLLITFSYVLYVPGLSSNLLSVWALTKTGIIAHVSHKAITFRKEGNEILRTTANRQLYVVSWIAKAVEEHALTAEDTESLLNEESDMRTGDVEMGEGESDYLIRLPHTDKEILDADWSRFHHSREVKSSS